MSVDIASRLAHVKHEIEVACSRSGREPQSVTLIAVSKTQPPEFLLEAVEAGAAHFGENRVEEAENKIPVVHRHATEHPTWHMIGHLQSRKAKDAAALFDVIHSVDTLKLGEKLGRIAGETGRTIDVLMEINISGEVNKHGFAAYDWENSIETRHAVFAAVDQIARLPALRLSGLMTMAPIVSAPEDARPVFSSLARLRRRLQDELGTELPHLSMGMTDDYPVAIEEGATMVRIGRAIFGERTSQEQG